MKNIQDKGTQGACKYIEKFEFWGSLCGVVLDVVWEHKSRAAWTPRPDGRGNSCLGDDW